MARTQARLRVAIWSNAEFVALDPFDQWVYLMLLSQPTISLCGVLALTPKRWTGYGPAVTVEQITSALERLEAARFILVDKDTDELLVRSFLRNDGVWNSPKTQAAALAQHANVLSGRLSEAIHGEIKRLVGPSSLVDTPSDDVSVTPDDRGVDTPRTCAHADSDSDSDSDSDTDSNSPAEISIVEHPRVVGGAGLRPQHDPVLQRDRQRRG